MKNIKDITISIFAIIGFVFILSSFTNQSQETHGTPESHVWELQMGTFTTSPAFAINKKTGEVRKYSAGYINYNKDGSIEDFSNDYIVMKPVE